MIVDRDHGDDGHHFLASLLEHKKIYLRYLESPGFDLDAITSIYVKLKVISIIIELIPVIEAQTFLGVSYNDNLE